MKILMCFLLVIGFIIAGCNRPVQTQGTSYKENLSNSDTSKLPKVSRHTKNRIKLDYLIKNKWANYKPDTLSRKYYPMAIDIQKDLANKKNLALIGYVEDCVQIDNNIVKILFNCTELINFQISLPKNEYEKFIQSKFVFYILLVNNIQFEFHPIQDQDQNKYSLLVNCDLIDFELADD